MKLSWSAQAYPLKRFLGISRNLQKEFHAVFVTIRQDGIEGRGESVPDAFFRENPANISARFAKLAGRLRNQRLTPDNCDPILDLAGKTIGPRGAALAGFDLALHDWLGKRLELPVWQLLGLRKPTPKDISYCVDLGELSAMIAQARAHCNYAWIKIKLGRDHDVDAVREIRRITGARLRLDANAGWSVKEAVAKLKAIGPKRIAFIEQPIAPGNPQGLARIRRETGIPVFADEGVKSSSDFKALQGCLDGINIKLMKCGGLREALRMIKQARDNGWQIMAGCRIETSLAITAAAHLAGVVDYLDLDGNLFLAQDPFKGAVITGLARLAVPKGVGLAVDPAG